ncbi:hypothetical protein [Roseateles amylovorans]|uniref:Uncharacterized protein n=1 Tax=Roseateles amylovorans TaxID=2978473 RepID=A0ABY6AW40_9BURK|nr:hypothetical protein [Roseateles amylovorans]UXH76614.1 hypothetical protein N4261_16380 [Roseateles amylovorans]
MIRWFRLFVIALLLPAYGLAAAGVSTYSGATPDPAAFRIEGQPSATPLMRSASNALPSPGKPIDLSTSPAVDGSLDRSLDDSGLLVGELGDTSDDMSDHCLTAAPLIAFTPPQAAPSEVALLRVPDAPPGRLLRPPRGLRR